MIQLRRLQFQCGFHFHLIARICDIYHFICFGRKAQDTDQDSTMNKSWDHWNQE